MPPTRRARTSESSSTEAGPEPNLKRALGLAIEMMAIPGKSGDEAEIAAFIAEKLRAAGAPAGAIVHDAAHKKTPIDGQVGNLIFKLPGPRGQSRRMLMAHLDTVPICVGAKPVRRNGRIHSANAKSGLGADDRAGAAVVLSAALEILERGLPHPPLTFLWPVQEEIGLHGARNARLSALGSPKLAFNWDGGSAAKLTIGATGGYRMKIEVEGLASHAGGAPQEGVSAIAIASLAIADLVRNGWHGLIEKDGKQGTSNVGVIRGGHATNVVTDLVELRAEARSHDSRFRKRIVAAIEKAFVEAARSIKSSSGAKGAVRFEGHLDYDSFRLSQKEPCVKAAAAAIQSLGWEPEWAIANGGLDANWMTARGIPTVSMGCGQLAIHTVNEQLDIAEFERACRVALRLATGEA